MAKAVDLLGMDYEDQAAGLKIHFAPGWHRPVGRRPTSLPPRCPGGYRPGPEA